MRIPVTALGARSTLIPTSATATSQTLPLFTIYFREPIEPLLHCH